MPKKKVLIVQSKVREYANKKGMRMGADAMARLSDKVRECIDEAANRAKASGRGTIKDRDF